MGRLAGFRYREIAGRLRRFGFEPSGRQHGSHEVWINRTTGKRTLLARHTGDMPEGTLRSILRQTGSTIDAFLAD